LVADAPEPEAPQPLRDPKKTAALAEKSIHKTKKLFDLDKY
jgi:hypothetical protein